MKLYFVRHGESEANLLYEFSNRGLKHGLTETGKFQAQSLAQTLQIASITKIFTSPLLRAIQTAEILAQALGIPYEIAEALREVDCGVLEGTSDEASWQAFWKLCDAWLKSRAWEARMEQGESFLDLQRRFVPFIERLVREYQSLPGGLVLVGHGGTYRCMLPLVLSNIDLEYGVGHGLSHTAVVIAEVKPAGLVCLAWGETVLAAA